MSVKWTRLGGVTTLECDDSLCAGQVVCTHTFDLMTTAAPDELEIPAGTLRLPMAGEFPNATTGGMFGTNLTVEKFGTFDAEVSSPINDYGTRKVMLPTTEDPQFLMMLNPEDAIVSIYSTTQEFVNSQVGYKPDDHFGRCTGTSHRPKMQKELDFLKPFLGAQPMLRFWDLLSKLQTGSCIVCMWKRGAANVSGVGASASGLGSL